MSTSVSELSLVGAGGRPTIWLVWSGFVVDIETTVSPAPPSLSNRRHHNEFGHASLHSSSLDCLCPSLLSLLPGILQQTKPEPE